MKPTRMSPSELQALEEKLNQIRERLDQKSRLALRELLAFGQDLKQYMVIVEHMTSW